MLQINSGKLFTRGVGRRNQLRGIIYTNLRFGRDQSVETVAGTLLSTSTLHHSSALVYELKEQIEAEPIEPGVLVSHGVEPYLRDFAALASFSLDVTSTPDPDLARRLTSGQRGLATTNAPQKLVRRVFDSEVWCQPQDAERLVAFTENLIGLQRTAYLAAMRAIRTYVTGLSRIADDLELAYTLLVASVESLAQGFDGHRASWADFEEEKRNAVDRALNGAPGAVAERVRSALLEVEHVSLARRFRDFTVAHLDPAYFREDAASAEDPIGRADLSDALGHAYRARSRYIHNLKELPRVLTLSGSFAETVRVDGATLLTLQGLARLAKHIITQFVLRQPTLKAEPYDYGLERAGIVQVSLAPQYWIGRSEGVTKDSGRSRLEGFLEQLTATLLKTPNSGVTDLREVLEKIERMMPTMKMEQRRPFTALYCLFNRLAPSEYQTTNAGTILRSCENELSTPSSESMFVHLILDLVPGWELSQHRAVHDTYFHRRHKKSGLHAPRALEAGVSLALAERYRVGGDVNQARVLIAFAVENLPGHGALRALEQTFGDEMPIDWRALLLPAAEGDREA